MGTEYGPRPPRLDGDNVTYDIGGLPARGLAAVHNESGGSEPVLPPRVSKSAPDAEVEAGGKPSKGTPKDGRLKPNKPASKKAK